MAGVLTMLLVGSPLALITAVVGCGADDESSLTDPERCEVAGGEWADGDPCNGAFWRCDFNGTCVTAIGEGCYCGDGSCWDGEQCLVEDGP